MNSARLLERISAEWCTTHQQYRDSKIKIGRLIREYIRQSLIEVDGLNEIERRKSVSGTRNQCVNCVKRKLNISNSLVNDLIRVSAVVDLLCPDTDLAKLSYASLRFMRVFVYRPNMGKTIRRGKKELKDGEVEPSEMELWLVRECYRRYALPIIHQGISGQWTSNRIMKEIYALSVVPDPRRRPRERKEPALDNITITSISQRSNTESPVVNQPSTKQAIIQQALNLCLMWDNPDELLRIVQQRLEDIRSKPVSMLPSREMRLIEYERRATNKESVT